jgi:hypothetical protein
VVVVEVEELMPNQDAITKMASNEIAIKPSAVVTTLLAFECRSSDLRTSCFAASPLV